MLLWFVMAVCALIGLGFFVGGVALASPDRTRAVTAPALPSVELVRATRGRRSKFPDWIWPVAMFPMAVLLAKVILSWWTAEFGFDVTPEP